MRVIILGIAGALVLVVSAFSQETPRSAGSLECSKQADAQGLHGAERAAFRSQCIANAGEPARQTIQQAAPPAASMTTQECAARYQAAQAAGTLAGRKWMEFRNTECGSASQPALKLVFPKGISPIYSQEPEGQGRMHTCVDQYNANKATNASGGMKWIESGGGYYSACNEHLKTAISNPSPSPARAPIKPRPAAAAVAAVAPMAAPPANVPLSQEEIDAFRNVIVNWAPAQGAPALDVRIRLKRDGTVDGAPEVLSTGAGATFEGAKESATRTTGTAL